MNKRKLIRYDPYNDFYFVLGVMPTATAEELQHAYRQRAKQVHPDLNRDRVDWANQQFQRLNEAYDVLSDPSLRIDYDRMRRNGNQSSAPGTANWWDRPHPPGQSARSTASPPRSTGTYHAAPGGPGPARATGTYNRATGTYSAAPRYRSGYSSKRRTGPQGVFGGPNRYLLSVTFALMGSFLICYGFLAATNLMSDNYKTAKEPRSQILVPAPASYATSGISPQCSDNVQITDPLLDQNITGDLTIFGTASHPDFYSYDVDVEWLGSNSENAQVQGRWTLNTAVYTPVTDSKLISVSNFGTLPTGYYILRLIVTLRSGDKLPACEVRVYRRRY